MLAQALVTLASAAAPVPSNQVLPAEMFFAGPAPIGMASVELTSDARTDLVLGADSGYQVAVLLADSKGGFEFKSKVNTGINQPTIVTGGEVNGDGRGDVVVAGNVWGQISVLLGDGLTGFGSVHLHSVGGRPQAIAIGSCGGSVHRDLAVACSEPNRVEVLLGSSTGAFTIAPGIALDATPRAIEAGNLNGSHDDDFVVLCDGGPNPGLRVLLSQPDGSLIQSSLLPMSNTVDLAIGSFSGDEHQDLLVARILSAENSALELYAGNGNGQFALVQSVPVLGAISALLAREMNGDSRTDAVLAAPDPVQPLLHSIGIALQMHAGKLSAPKQYYTGLDATGVASADYDGDGLIDVTLTTGSFAALLRGDGRGAILSGKAYPSTSGTSPRDVAAADVDSDGISDLVVLQSLQIFGDGTIMVRPGDELGAFGNPTVSGTQQFPRGLTLGDVDGDARIDAAVVAPIGGLVEVLRNTGDASFVHAASLPVGLSPQEAEFADLDLDGNLDVLCVNATTDDVSMILGLGDGSFAATVQLPTGPGPLGMAVGDVNLDGYPDALTANSGSIDLSLFLSSGSGGLLPVTPVAATSPARDVALGDIDGDGLLDIASSQVSGPNVYVIPSLGAAGFEHGKQITLEYEPTGLTIADINLDGHGDILAATELSLVIVPSTGAFDFQGPRAFAAGSTSAPPAVADFDRDGWLDVATNNEPMGLVAVLPNLLTAPQGIVTYGPASPGCFGDLVMSTAAKPTLGNAAFALFCSNAPRETTGLGVLSSLEDPLGTDPFGLGVLLNVDAISGAWVLFATQSDLHGLGRANLPIPADPSLLDTIVYAQTLWFETPGFACGGSPLHLTASRGVAIRILP